MSGVCARRSRPTPRIHATSARCGGSAIGSSHEREVVSSNRWVLPATIALLGTGATASIAAVGRLPAGDALVLVLYAAGAATVAVLASVAVLVVLRRQSVVLQAAVVALAPVFAVGIGVGAAASAMFISTHDLHALLVVLSAAGTVGVLSGLLLGRRVATAGRSLGVMARNLGVDESPVPAFEDLVDGGRAVPSELASLAAELEATSARLVEARAETAGIEHSRRQLVAWVSHDLRTPLAGIRAMVEALEDGVVDDPETVARYYRTMRGEVDRLSALVHDLFELSRIEAGALELDLERVPLDELVSEALAGASVIAGAKGIDLRGAVGEPSPVVELSTPEMSRVVRNLLDNAIRHTAPGGTVWIDAALDDAGTAAVVSVRDACGGIPEHDLDHVFEMAYRGDAARTPGSAGAGLGLAFARGLVEAHHGTITVRNEGDGCRFTVRLPVSGTTEP
ncbi:MAG: HAMP domain-containing histidine kinase [Acidimicrobiia bacterium]|nr:HAMP domain-containing histidine kinase [Acidimicrobiia bacterium]